MAVPVAMAQALELERPVYMGCSIGGLLALDLARYHPDDFRAVIGRTGVESRSSTDALAAFCIPRGDHGEYKRR